MAALALLFRSPLALSACTIFLIDRLSKFWVMEIFDLGNRQVFPVAPPYLVFRMAWNRGINFGFLANIGIDAEIMRWSLVALSVAISAALAWWARRRTGTPGAVVFALGAGTVIGGALSNAWDRVFFENAAVFDFLNMSCCGIDNPYAFNIADVAIFAGAALIALKA